MDHYDIVGTSESYDYCYIGDIETGCNIDDHVILDALESACICLYM